MKRIAVTALVLGATMIFSGVTRGMSAPEPSRDHRTPATERESGQRDETALVDMINARIEQDLQREERAGR